MKATQKFKKGQSVKVIYRHEGHRFKIGSIVKIKKCCPESNGGTGDYLAIDKFGMSWWLVDSEIEQNK